MKKYIFIIFIFCILIMINCKKPIEKSFLYDEMNYTTTDEIFVPTDYPRGLAFDGKYLWYSDDSLNSFFKISDEGKILQTINIPGCQVSGFDFSKNYIFCINDTFVVNYNPIDSTEPKCCIYKINLTGQKIDSFLLRSPPHPYNPQYMGITTKDSFIYVSRAGGFSSEIIRINMNSKSWKRLDFEYFNALEVYKEKIYALDSKYSHMIAPLNSSYNMIEEEALTLTYPATNFVFIHDSLFVCDRENKKIIKISHSFQ